MTLAPASFTLPAGANVIFVLAFLAVAAMLLVANWGKRSRL